MPVSKTRQKKAIDKNVWEASLDRIRYIYDSFDKVQVSFSGGKDSTCVLNATLEVAREKGKLPLEVIFYDEEAIHPTTIDYVRRVSKNPDINLKWYCLEFKHRNACSNEEPWWYCWEKDKKDIWVRELPKEAITKHKGFRKGMTIPDFCKHFNPISDGRVALLTGIRTAESIRRYRIICARKEEAYINRRAEPRSNTYKCHPVYDWETEDVWIGVAKFGWDYNKTYDIVNQTKFHGKYLAQRVSPPFGEEPLGGLWLYAECFPEMWEKMLGRVKGVASAWRYAKTELYGNVKKPDHITWRDYVKVVLDSYPIGYRNDVKKRINHYINSHKSRTSQEIPQNNPGHPCSGTSWQFLARVATKGDFKGRQAHALPNFSLKACDQLGITLEEALIKFK
tara:strand:- start:5656 stop:6837 length:1182 start_codon:yes stop_codon:yes gene_type:complete